MNDKKSLIIKNFEKTKKGMIMVIMAITFLSAFVIDDLYDSGDLTIQWEYFAIFLSFIGFIIGTYGYFKYSFPKFRNFFKRWFKGK